MRLIAEPKRLPLIPDAMRGPLRPGVGRGSALLRRARVQLTYLWRHRRLANIGEPVLLTEHIQRRKLYDRDPRLPLLADKVAVKAFVGERLGEHWLIPTLWRGRELPPDAVWPTPFVVKSRHGCGHIRVVTDEARDYPAARAESARWMRSRYGRWLDEWLYGEIAPGLLVEPYVGEGPELPVDYKLFVFGRRVRLVQVHLQRATRHRWIVMDLAWRRRSPASKDPDPPRPASLASMIAAAERLSEGFPFVRVDFYEVGGKPLFGEMTFYPGSGLELVEPACLDAEMGEWWTRALLDEGGEVESMDAA